MKIYVLALATLAAIGLSGAAFAGEATHPAKAMSDSELDKVTAGDILTSNTAIDLTNGNAPFNFIRVPDQVSDNNLKAHPEIKVGPLGPSPSPQP